MRHSKLFLFSAFSLATVLMIGCGDDGPKKRARINTSNTRGTNPTSGSVGDSAALAAQFKGGAPVASTDTQTMSVESIDQTLKQKTSGAKRISLETLQLGTYQLVEVINVARKMTTAQGQSAGVIVEGHSAKIEVDQAGTIKLHALNPFGTKMAPVNRQGRPFNVAVQFDVLKDDLKVHSAIAYFSKVENGKRDTKAIAGDLEADNLVVELKASRAKVNNAMVYVIRQDKDNAEFLTLFENGDSLILSKDLQKTVGGNQLSSSSMLIYKKIAAPPAGADAAATAATAATAAAAATAATASQVASGPANQSAQSTTTTSPAAAGSAATTTDTPPADPVVRPLSN